MDFCLWASRCHGFFGRLAKKAKMCYASICSFKGGKKKPKQSLEGQKKWCFTCLELSVVVPMFKNKQKAGGRHTGVAVKICGFHPMVY